MPERPRSILETVLYADDLDAAAAFYRDVIGLSLSSDMRPLSLAFRVGPGSVLLIFDPSASEAEGRVVPSHGARGAGHVAFVISDESYDDWLSGLPSAGVEVEQEHAWGRGRSIYVRDPAGNSVELVTEDIWP